MLVKEIIGYVLILLIAAGLIAAWRLTARKRRRERSSSRINLID
ncbi:MAG TPA: hypothetical protein VIT45_13495 [Allosphingosinicella sp.]